MKKSSAFGALAASIATVAFLTTPAFGASNNTLAIDEYAVFDNLDPAIAYAGLDYEVTEQIYTPLVSYKEGTAQIIPDGAKSWHVSKDGLTYTFQLRKNLKFSNGDPCTAQNYIDQFERILTPSVGSPGESFLNPIVKGSAEFYKGKAKTISGIAAPNPYTLVIKLIKPEAFFKYVLAIPFFVAVDPAYIHDIGAKKFATEPMGTGPFMVKSYNGQEMVLVRNPHYFQRGIPKLNEVDITVETNPQTAVLRFKQGTTAFLSDNVTSIDSSDFISMYNNPQWKADFHKLAQNTLVMINLNNSVKPFNNKLVRQAVNYAVNKARLVQLQNGRAQVANQYLAPYLPGYQKNLPARLNYDYNLAKARELLRKAGYPTGFKTQLIVPPGTPANQVESIQADLQKVGIQMSIVNATQSAYGQYVAAGKSPMLWEEWGQDFPDPYDFLDSFLNSDNIANTINISHYSNATVDKELNKAANMPSGKARLALYDKAQDQALSDAALLPLYYPVLYSLVQPWVKGFVMNPVLEDPLQDISVAPH